MKKIIILLFCFTLSAYASSDTLAGKVIKINDGDTIHVLQNNRIKEKIRLAGINLPHTQFLTHFINSSVQLKQHAVVSN